jgi:Caspase domain
MLLVSVPLVSTAAEKRIALVVGNSAYRAVPPLDNPKNDAVLIARTLKDLGFTLIGDGAQLDLDKAALDRAVQTFGRQLQGAEIALFYYAGHGVQVRGSNYLVPVDANPAREVDVDFQMMDVNLVLRQMESSGTRLNLVILDACRNNPFGGRGLRGSAPGLAQIRAPEGTLISYATQPGNVAQDGVDGDSPYSKALAMVLRRPGLDIFQAFNEVGLAVKRVTGGEQQPWTSSSPINGNFYFAGVAVNSPESPKVGAATHSDNAAAGAPKDCSGIEMMLTNVARSNGENAASQVLPPPASTKPSWELIKGVTAFGLRDEVPRCKAEKIPETDHVIMTCGLAPSEVFPPGASIYNAKFNGITLTLAQTRALEGMTFTTFEQCLGRPIKEDRGIEDGFMHIADWSVSRGTASPIDLDVVLSISYNKKYPSLLAGFIKVERSEE